MTDEDMTQPIPEGARHDQAVALLAEMLGPLGGRGYVIRVGQHLEAGALAIPRPDLAVTGSSHMDLTPGRIAHAIFEVAETSAMIDLYEKAPKYAAIGVPLYVVVDIEDRYSMVHTEPGSEGYGAVQRGDYMTVLGLGVDLVKLYDVTGSDAAEPAGPAD